MRHKHKGKRNKLVILLIFVTVAAIVTASVVATDLSDRAIAPDEKTHKLCVTKQCSRHQTDSFERSQQQKMALICGT
jgi:hypothetical protein